MIGYDYEMTSDPAGERFEVEPSDLLFAAIAGRSIRICRFLSKFVDGTDWPVGKWFPADVRGEETKKFCESSGIDVLTKGFVSEWNVRSPTW